VIDGRSARYTYNLSTPSANSVHWLPADRARSDACRNCRTRQYSAERAAAGRSDV